MKKSKPELPLLLIIEEADDRYPSGEYLAGYPIVTSAQRMNLVRYWIYRAARWCRERSWLVAETPSDDLPVNIAIEIKPEHFRAILSRAKGRAPRASITFVPPCLTVPLEEARNGAI